MDTGLHFSMFHVAHFMPNTLKDPRPRTLIRMSARLRHMHANGTETERVSIYARSSGSVEPACHRWPTKSKNPKQKWEVESQLLGET